LKVSDARFFWYARYHHIVMDAYGMALVARHVAAAYTALRNSQPPTECCFESLAEVVSEDSAYRASPNFIKDREYWAERLERWPDQVGLSSDVDISSGSGGFIRATAHLEPAMEAELRNLAGHLNTSFARVLVAALAIFLH